MIRLKKGIIIILCSCMILPLSACKNNTSKTSKHNSSTSAQKAFDVNQLSIKDFKWEISEGKDNGFDRLYFSITNNSKFNLLGVEVHFKPKETATDEQLSIFDSFYEEHNDYINGTESDTDISDDTNDEDDEEDNDSDDLETDEVDDYSFNSSKIILANTSSKYSKLNISGEVAKLIPKGETYSDISLSIYNDDLSWDDVPSTEQFNLMEIKELTILLLGPSNTGYIAYYNFDNQKWSLDKKTVIVDKWSTHDIGNYLPNPKAAHYIVTTDVKSDFDILSYGITKDQYDTYIKKLIKSGFKTDEDYEESESIFKGENSKGYTVTAWFDETTESMNLEIEK